MHVGTGDVLGDSRGHVLGKIDRYGVANHLLDIRLVALELKVTGEGLYVAAFKSGQGAYSLLRLYGVVGMYLVAVGHRAINTTDGRAWLVYRENTPTYITARMAIVVFNTEGVAEIVAHGHGLDGQSAFDERFHEPVHFAQFADEEKAQSLLRDTAVAGIKHLLRKPVASFLEDFLCLDEFLRLGDAGYILHNEPLGADLADDFCIRSPDRAGHQ